MGRSKWKEIKKKQSYRVPGFPVKHVRRSWRGHGTPSDNALLQIKLRHFTVYHSFLPSRVSDASDRDGRERADIEPERNCG